MTRIYVDDRTFATSRAWSIHDRFHHWCAWSASVGLIENRAKAVAVASTPARRATLRRLLPEVVANDVELLGSCSMVSRRGLLPKEASRVDACKRVLVLLACASFFLVCGVLVLAASFSAQTMLLTVGLRVLHL